MQFEFGGGKGNTWQEANTWLTLIIFTIFFLYYNFESFLYIFEYVLLPAGKFNYIKLSEKN